MRRASPVVLVPGPGRSPDPVRGRRKLEHPRRIYRPVSRMANKMTSAASGCQISGRPAENHSITRYALTHDSDRRCWILRFLVGVDMIHKTWFTLFMLVGLAFSVSCNPAKISPTTQANIPNPASVHCEQNGGKLDLQQDASGGAAGACVFPDGSECDEWAYFRGECKPGDSLVKPTLAPTRIITRTPYPTASPTASPILSECPGAPAISNKQKIWTQVSLNPPMSQNVRKEPGLTGQRLGRLKPGEIVWIANGPRCADDLTWWFVQSLTGLEGWTAEGDAKAYWLLQPLDAFFYDTVDQSAASNVVLKIRHKYRIIMSGTYSLWGPQQWTDQGVCIQGDSELHPMFPSAGKTNGRVGADPYYHFARPFYGPCQKPRDPSETISAMMFSLDGGSNYSIPTPVIAEYRDDHTYRYVVTGRDFPLRVKLDDAVLADNYGQILTMIEAID